MKIIAQLQHSVDALVSFGLLGLILCSSNCRLKCRVVSCHVIHRQSLLIRQYLLSHNKYCLTVINKYTSLANCILYTVSYTIPSYSYNILYLNLYESFFSKPIQCVLKIIYNSLFILFYFIFSFLFFLELFFNFQFFFSFKFSLFFCIVFVIVVVFFLCFFVLKRLNIILVMQLHTFLNLVKKQTVKQSQEETWKTNKQTNICT